MLHIVTSLEIDAAPDEVWEQFLDKRRWKDFSRFVDLSPQSPIKAGGAFWFGIRFFGVPPAPLRPAPLRVKVLRCDAPLEVRWIGGIPAFPFFRGEHYFRFEALGPGRTRLVHGEQFLGPLARPVLSLLGGNIRETYEAFNHGLARQAALARHQV